MMRGQSDRAITDRILTESCDYLEAFSILLNNRIQLIIDKVKSESKKGSTRNILSGNCVQNKMSPKWDL